MGLKQASEVLEDFYGTKLEVGGDGERSGGGSGLVVVVAAAEYDGLFAAVGGGGSGRWRWRWRWGGVGPDDEELEGVGGHVGGREKRWRRRSGLG